MNILSIGGSDPSSGAGIQSDIRVFSALGAHTLTAITAVTSQNTSEFGAVEPVSPGMLQRQLESVFSDFRVDGIKIGMVYNSKIIRAIRRQLDGSRIPIVVDPVMRSTTGGRLIEGGAARDFQRHIIPLATAITPNIEEAEALAGISVAKDTPERVAKKIQDMGAKNVAITGIEKGDRVSDFILEKNTTYAISGKKVAETNRGSGCVHAAATTYSLACGKSIRESLYFARRFAYGSIKNAKRSERGL